MIIKNPLIINASEDLDAEITALENSTTQLETDVDALPDRFHGQYNIKQIIDGDTCELQITTAVPTGDHLITVIDYDGTVLQEEKLNEGDVFTLPEAPIHERLDFVGWSSALDIVNNTITMQDYDVVVGPMYSTKSGDVEIDIELTEETGLTVNLQSNIYGYKNWGDGTRDTTSQHTYQNYGKYMISFKTTTLSGSYSSSSGYRNIFSTNSNKYCVNVRLPINMTIIGSYAFYGCARLETISSGNEITTFGLNYSFNSCINLKALVIPNSVINCLGQYCFSSCLNLKYIVIPKGETELNSYVFSTCVSLKTLILPDGITNIQSYAISSCYDLKYIRLPNSITNMTTDNFSGCNSLKELTLPNNSVNIPSHGGFGYVISGGASLNTLIVPSNFKHEGEGSFNVNNDRVNFTTLKISNLYNWISSGGLGSNFFKNYNMYINDILVKDLIIPDEIVIMPSYIFARCLSIESVTIPSTVKTIDSYAFNECYNLISININDGLNKINYGAFYSCRKLKNISIPDTISYIGRSVFDYCTCLRPSITENNIQYLGNATNPRVVVWKITNKNLSSYNINENCKVIFNQAFSGCSNLTSITIPNSVTQIGYASFNNCTSLSSITIPDSVTSIGDQSFSVCRGLISVTIGNGVTSIESGAFRDCSNLTAMTILAATPPTLENTGAISTATTTIYVPAGTKSVYESATNWSALTTRETNPVTFIELSE